MLALPRNVAEELSQRGVTVPNPITGLALIDTGASLTAIDETAAKNMNLPIIDVATIASATDAGIKANVYPAQLQIAGAPIEITVGRALGAMLEPQGLLALLGRDFLQHLTMFYNGPRGQLTISV